MHAIDLAEPSRASSLSAGVAMACVGLVFSWIVCDQLGIGTLRCGGPLITAWRDTHSILSSVRGEGC